MAERRYSEEEVAEILDRATKVREEASGRQLSSPRGLTLAELKEIGAEAGIDTDLIERAAGEIDRPTPSTEPKRRMAGIPIGVGRTVYLDRPLTDDEWNRLVVDLRETFDARGNVREEGAFRQWNNGNLQALVEPTDDGERLRLKTTSGRGRMFIGFGGTMIAVVTLLALVSMFTGAGSAWDDIIPLLLIGGAFVGSQAIRLPRWARTRQLQMEGIIDRLKARMDDAPSELTRGPSGEAPEESD